MAFGNPADKHRKTLKAKEGSWHLRLYEWWLAHGGHNQSGYKENFCHYVRVFLVWTPYLWFFKVPIKAWIKPWMIAVAIMALFGALTLLVLAPDKFWGLIGLLLLLTGIFSLIVGSLILADYMREYPDKKSVRVINRILDVLFLIIIIPFLPFFYFNDWTRKRYKRNIAGWFFFEGRWKVIYPWTVTAVASIALSWYVFGAGKTLEILAIMAGFTIGITLFFLALIALMVGSDRFRSWHHKRQLEKSRSTKSTLTAIKPEQGTSTVVLAVQFVMAQKNRICPFIELPDRFKSSSEGDLSRRGGMDN